MASRRRSPRAGYGEPRRDRAHDRDDYRPRERRDDEYDRRQRRADDSYRPSRRNPSPRRRSRSPRRDHNVDQREYRDQDRVPGHSRDHGKDGGRRAEPTRERASKPQTPKPLPTSERDTKTGPADTTRNDGTIPEAAVEEANLKKLRAQIESKRDSSSPLKAVTSALPPTDATTSATSTTLQRPSTNGVIAKKPGFKSISSSTNSAQATSDSAVSTKPSLTLPTLGKLDIKKNIMDAGISNKKRAAVNLGSEEVKRRKLEHLPDEPVRGDVDAMDEGEDGVSDDVITTAPVNADDEPDPLDAYMLANDAQLAADVNGTKATSTDNLEKPAIMTVSDEEEDDELLTTIDDEINDIKSLKKKKEVPVVDWSKVELVPFDKKFYKESADVQNLTEEEVDEILARDNIKIRGKKAPRPILRWENASFPSNIMSVIENELKFEAPTPIQAVALPTLMSGRDAIAIAQTGSGKTLAYVLPMLRHIAAKPRPTKKEAKSPAALILVPTRELCTQVHTNARPFTKQMGLKMVSVYGGASISEQIALIQAGIDIIITTPGRAIEFLGFSKLDLHRVTFLVLDEADRMLDMGFEPQISKIAGNIRPDRQTCCFSATFNRKMDAIARNYLHNPIEIIVEGKSTIPDQVTVEVRVVPETAKFFTLLEILGDFSLKDEDPRTLIFVNQQKSADDLLNKLLKAGYPCNSIYGSKDQQDRAEAISDFASGAIPILIGTSVAARGLDIEQLKLVIEYDPADHMEDHIHRIGRTGRAGKPGRAVCFISESQAVCAAPLVKALKASKREVPKELEALVDHFEELVKAGKAQHGSSGFGGRGLERIDQEHDSERRAQRLGAGVEVESKVDTHAGSDDEDDAMTQAIWAKAKGADADNTRSAEEQARLDEIDNIAINVRRRDTPAETRADAGGADGLDAATLAARKIASRLSSKNTIRSGQSLDNKGPDAGAFHATLEINDFGQRARWQATNRSNITKLLDKGHCSITNKGNFYAKGTQPGPNDPPKLYILVEGESEAIVSEVMKDLIELLKKGEIEEQQARAPTATARYNPLGK